MHTHDMHDDISNDTNNSNNIIISDSSRKGLKAVSGEEDSPLRVALSTNPLLTASLNSPPVHMAAASSQSLSISANGSVDLSSHASSLRSKRLLAGNEPADRISPDGHTSPCSSSTATSSKEMYANLLMQLRNQGITAAQSSNSEEPHAHNHNSSNLKMSAAARKEKLKSQLCFQCPVCKKRFQRHIAMNAHFQAEHLGSMTSKSDGCKVCKLCAYVGQDMSSIRHHLLVKHSIDLDTPTACLAEPDTNPASPCGNAAGSNSRSGSSSPLPSSSSDKKSLSSSLKHCFSSVNNNNTNSNTNSSSPAVSIIRTTIVPKSEDGFITSSSAASISRSSLSPANVVVHETSAHGLHLQSQSHVKQERRSEIEVMQVEEAKDLSMKKTVLPKRSASPAALLLASTSSDCSSSTGGSTSHSKKRHKTERVSQRIVISSTPSSSPASNNHETSSLSNLVMQQMNSQWQCPHCNITFPDQTLYFLHRGFHSNTNPWKCNGCGQRCTDMYDFNTHLMSDVHH